MGYLNFDEPFKSLIHQGVILGPDGMKMSKSRGNVISPDEYISTYGSDVFRMYLMFGFSYTEGGPWNSDGIKAIAKYFDRIERVATTIIGEKADKSKNGKLEKEEKELLYARHYAIKCVDRDMNNFSFNTAIARLMEFTNALIKYDTLPEEEKNVKLLKESLSDFILLLAPCAPHFAEELWEMVGNKKSVFTSNYPICDESALVKDETEVAVQINSKMRGKIMLQNGLSQEEIKEVLLKEEKIASALAGKEIKKMIVIPGRLINIIV